MYHAVHTADVNKGTVGGKILDDTGVALTDLELLPDGSLGGLLLLDGNAADRSHSTLALLVDVDDAGTLGGPNEHRKVGILGEPGAGCGDKHAIAHSLDDHAALVGLDDGTLDDSTLVLHSDELIPALVTVHSLLGQGHDAVGVADTDDKEAKLIANLEHGAEVGILIIGDLVTGQKPGSLHTDIHVHDIFCDARHDTGHGFSCI